MTKVLLIEKYPSNTDWHKYLQFTFDKKALVNKNVKRLLKKDITLDLSIIDNYDYVILVGAEPLKFVAKKSGILDIQGTLISDKFIPIISPAVLYFKPEYETPFLEALNNLHRIVNGEVKAVSADIKLISSTEEFIKYIDSIPKGATIAVDTETTALYPRDGYVIGISISHKEKQGVFIDSECISEDSVIALQSLFNRTKQVFHNAKFDISMLRYHFNLSFKEDNIDDTLIMHYVLDERVGTHGLKQLANKYTDFLNYESELEEFKKQYCKKHKIKISEFTYDLVPIDILYKYAAIDTAVTLEVYNKLSKELSKDSRLCNIYKKLIEATFFLIDVENAGIPFDKEELLKAREELSKELFLLEQELYSFPEIKKFEKEYEVQFNVNSVNHLRVVLFDYLKLSPIKTTDTGQFSTDAETLESLANINPLPKLFLKIKKLKRVKSAYIDKIIPVLDSDNRLRTNFNLTSTTSGRLSSSGKLNVQQLPRDNKIVKRCIKANPGYKIHSQDLVTAEMYVAAILSGDTNLQAIFTKKGDFHSNIAKLVFNLKCPVEEIKEKYKQARQASKAISFGILYGSGAAKVAETANIPLDRAIEIIGLFFKKFPKLYKWLQEQKQNILRDGYVYSIFGRKRRLLNINSKSTEVQGHEIRSGVNFLIQSVASDINLFAAIELNKWIKENNIDAKIIMLVHDSIVAEVAEKHLDIYSQKVKEFVQRDIGVSIPNCPIGVDQEIGDNYAFE